MNAATTTEQRVTELRHEGVRLALRLLMEGHPVEHAVAVMEVSVSKQARVSGLRL